VNEVQASLRRRGALDPLAMARTDPTGAPRVPIPSTTIAVIVRFVGILLVLGSILRRSSDAATAHWLAVAGWGVFAAGAALDLLDPARRTALRWIVLVAALAIVAGHLYAVR
jgi:hypothetical protein